MNLPNKLKNMGITPVPKEKLKVVLSDQTVRILADVLIPTHKEESA